MPTRSKKPPANTDAGSLFSLPDSTFSLPSRETLHVEFKTARDSLPGNLFDTVCAFLNTDGGTIYLGVEDDGTVSGVAEAAVTRLRREIADCSNNPQKLDPPYLLFPRAETRDGKTIITLQVPLSSQIHRHKGEIYLRSEDGDYRVKGTHQLAGLLNRKLGIFPEQTPLPAFSLGDLRISLRERIFREAISNIIAHRDYRNATPGRLLIYEDRVVLDNPSTQYFHQPITPRNLASHPKNPSLCKFMIQLGRFDELGSGVINIHKYLPAYAHGAHPLFEDTREGFRLTLPLSLRPPRQTGTDPAPPQVTEQVTEQVAEQVTEQVKRLIEAVGTQSLGTKELMRALNLRHRPSFLDSYLTPALQGGLLEMTQPDSPRSPTQKYRLTAKGRSLLK